MRFAGYWIEETTRKIIVKPSWFDETELDPETEWKMAWQNSDPEASLRGFIQIADAREYVVKLIMKRNNYSLEIATVKANKYFKASIEELEAIKLCKRKATSADELRSFVGLSDRVDRLIAKHPNSDCETLLQLSGESAEIAFKNLLINPKSSFETILEAASSLTKSTTDYKGESSCYYPSNYSPIVYKLLPDFFKKHDYVQKAIQLVRDKNCSESILHALLGAYPAVDRLIAKHPNANSDLLDILVGISDEGMVEVSNFSKDKIARKNVFLNPNLSNCSVMILGREFPEKFIKIPSLREILTDDPLLIYRLGAKPLFSILSSYECPQELLNWACKYGGPEEQLAVWTNSETPTRLRTEMMKSGYVQEANVILEHCDKLQEFADDLNYDESDISAGVEPSSFIDYGFTARFDALWKKLVPKKGEAETIQGEMVRALGRMEGDYFRNGFGNWYPTFYDFSQFLIANLIDESTFKPFTLSVLRADIRTIVFSGNTAAVGEDLEGTITTCWGGIGTEDAMNRIAAAIVVWCERNPKLIPYKH